MPSCLRYISTTLTWCPVRLSTYGESLRRMGNAVRQLVSEPMKDVKDGISEYDRYIEAVKASNCTNVAQRVARVDRRLEPMW